MFDELEQTSPEEARQPLKTEVLSQPGKSEAALLQLIDSEKKLRETSYDGSFQSEAFLISTGDPRLMDIAFSSEIEKMSEQKSQSEDINQSLTALLARITKKIGIRSAAEYVTETDQSLIQNETVLLSRLIRNASLTLDEIQRIAVEIASEIETFEYNVVGDGITLSLSKEHNFELKISRDELFSTLIQAVESGQFDRVQAFQVFISLGGLDFGEDERIYFNTSFEGIVSYFLEKEPVLFVTQIREELMRGSEGHWEALLVILTRFAGKENQSMKLVLEMLRGDFLSKYDQVKKLNNELTELGFFNDLRNLNRAITRSGIAERNLSGRNNENIQREWDELFDQKHKIPYLFVDEQIRDDVLAALNQVKNTGILNLSRDDAESLYQQIESIYKQLSYGDASTFLFQFKNVLSYRKTDYSQELEDAEALLRTSFFSLKKQVQFLPEKVQVFFDKVEDHLAQTNSIPQSTIKIIEDGLREINYLIPGNQYGQSLYLLGDTYFRLQKLFQLFDLDFGSELDFDSRSHAITHNEKMYQRLQWSLRASIDGFPSEYDEYTAIGSGGGHYRFEATPTTNPIFGLRRLLEVRRGDLIHDAKLAAAGAVERAKQDYSFKNHVDSDEAWGLAWMIDDLAYAWEAGEQEFILNLFDLPKEVYTRQEEDPLLRLFKRLRPSIYAQIAEIRPELVISDTESGTSVIEQERSSIEDLIVGFGELEKAFKAVSVNAIKEKLNQQLDQEDDDTKRYERVIYSFNWRPSLGRPMTDEEQKNYNREVSNRLQREFTKIFKKYINRITSYLMTEENPNSREEVLQFFSGKVLPLITESPHQMESLGLKQYEANTFRYDLKNTISILYASLTTQEKLVFLPEFTALYNETEIQVSGSSAYINWREIFATIDDIEAAIELLISLVQKYLESGKNGRLHLSSHFPHYFRDTLDYLLVKDPNYVISVVRKFLEDLDPNSTYLLTRNYQVSLWLFEDDEKTEALRGKVESVAWNDLDISFALSFLAGYLDTDTYEQKNAELLEVRTFFEEYQASDQVEDSKKVADLGEFFISHQSSIAKLLMLFPETNHGAAILIETVRDFGFPRLEARLEQLEEVTFEDILFVHQQLQSLPDSQINQGLILSIITTISAFKDRALSDNDAWMEVLSSNEFTTASEVREALGREFLVAIAVSLGLDPENVRQTSLDNWNLHYLPRLIEAKQKFEQDPVFKLMFTVLIKASFRGEFTQMIDPRYDFDLTPYEQDEDRFLDERRMVEIIRRMNQDTLDRFKALGLDIDAFAQGAERQLTGRITAQEIVEDAHSEFELRVTGYLDESERLGLPAAASKMVAEVRSALGVLRDGSADADLSGIKHLLAFYESGEQPVEKVTASDVGFDRDSKIRVFSLLHKHFVEEKEINRGPVSTVEQFVFDQDPEFAKAVKNKCLRSLPPNEEGYVRFVADEVTNPKALLELVKEREVTLRQKMGDDDYQALFDELRPVEETQRPEQQSKPDLEKNILLLQQSVQTLIQELRKLLEDKQQIATLGIDEEALKLNIDHLTTIQYAVTSLIKILKQAKDQDYDVVLNRWARQPGEDLFFGNKLICCVAIENFNGFGMMQFLFGLGFECTQMVDQVTQDTFGGTFDYVGQRIDSNSQGDVVSLNIDNIEVNDTHAFLARRIRTAVAEMGDEVLAKMIVSEDTKSNGVLLGDAYNDVSTSDLPTEMLISRVVSGTNGAAMYTDTSVKATDMGAMLRNPTAFMRHPVNRLSGSPVPRQERESFGGSATVLDFNDPQQVLLFKERFFNQAITLEKSSLGTWSQHKAFEMIFESDTGEVADEFRDVVFVYVAEGDTLLGVSYGYPAGDSETIYLDSSSVDWHYQNRGVGRTIRDAFEVEAKQRGFTYLTREAMADTGYAQRSIRQLAAEGRLVEPDITEDEVEEWLNNPEKLQVINGMGNRVQIRITSRL